jgi:hypothetical protein
MTRRWSTARAMTTLPAACALALTACARPAPGAGEPSPALMDALRADGRVEVMVTLTPPPGYEPGRAPDAGTRAAIARLQDDVLDGLDPADFRLRTRFRSIPALAGTVLTERGLRALAADPRVARVDRDPGGGGGAS